MPSWASTPRPSASPARRANTAACSSGRCSRSSARGGSIWWTTPTSRAYTTRCGTHPTRPTGLLAVLSKLFAWAERRGYRPGLPNPCRGLERYREVGRERFLSAEELARLGDALRAMEAEGTIDPYAAAAIRLLILTGARRGEILSLRWAWVDPDAGTARLPDSKTGKKVLHLSAPALAVLQGMPRLEGNPHVIVGKKPGAALVGLPKIWDRVRARAGLGGVRLHDLRHSFASVAALSGTSLLVIGKLLGHAQHATTFRYAHLAHDPVAAAGDAVARRIATAMAGTAAADQDPAPTAGRRTRAAVTRAPARRMLAGLPPAFDLFGRRP